MSSAPSRTRAGERAAQNIAVELANPGLLGARDNDGRMIADDHARRICTAIGRDVRIEPA
jgi:hypothetical protein